MASEITTNKTMWSPDEAVDIFAAFSAASENSIKKEIAKIWGVSVTEGETDNQLDLRVGRVILKRTQPVIRKLKPFVGLRTLLHVLEKIACFVKHNEPVLLVGETGTEKTTLLQNLAMRLGQPLTVLGTSSLSTVLSRVWICAEQEVTSNLFGFQNLSQQSDVADLLGGIKPIDP